MNIFILPGTIYKYLKLQTARRFWGTLSYTLSKSNQQFKIYPAIASYLLFLYKHCFHPFLSLSSFLNLTFYQKPVHHYSHQNPQHAHLRRQIWFSCFAKAIRCTPPREHPFHDNWATSSSYLDYHWPCRLRKINSCPIYSKTAQSSLHWRGWCQ